MPLTPEQKRRLEDLRKRRDQFGAAEQIPPVPITVPEVLKEKLGVPVEEIGTSTLETTEDIAKGLAEGATLGFAGEIAGAAGATGEKIESFLRGEKGRAWLETYREKQRAAEKALEEARERSPYAFGAGEIAGTVLPALTTAGAGLTVTGARGAAALGRRALLREAGKAALTGAQLGAVQAAGVSKAELLGAEEAQRERFAADVIGGAATGGVFGGVIAGTAMKVTPGIKQKLKNYIEESPKLKQFLTAKQMARGGEVISEAPEAIREMGLKRTETVTNMTKRFTDAEDTFGKMIGDVLDNSTAKGVKIDISNEVINTAKELGKAIQDNPILRGRQDATNLIQELYKLPTAKLSPRALFDLRQIVLTIAQDGKSSQIINIANKFQRGIKDNLEKDLPPLGVLSKVFNKLRRSGSETIIARGRDPELVDVWYGDLRKAEKNLYDNIEGILDRLRSPGAEKRDEAATFANLLKNLEAFKKDPEIIGKLKELGFKENAPETILKKFKLDPETLKKDIEDISDKFSIQRHILGYQPRTIGLRSLSPSEILERTVTGFSPFALGRAYGAAQTIGVVEKKLAPMAKKLYQASENTLGTIANVLMKMPGTQKLGASLMKGLSEKNAAAKNAALFTIMQNPKARLLISAEDLPELRGEEEIEARKIEER